MQIELAMQLNKPGTYEIRAADIHSEAIQTFKAMTNMIF